MKRLDWPWGGHRTAAVGGGQPRVVTGDMRNFGVLLLLEEPGG